MKKKGFTLVSLLVALAILGILFTYTTMSTSGFIDTLRLKAAVKEVVSALRAAQAKAIASKQTVKISFASNKYTIDGKAYSLPGKVRSLKDKEIRFSSSGYPPVGYSGTLTLTSGKHSKKVIISSHGRIRIE